ncbi:MAG: hypothetical protein Q4G52_10575 [Clostridia bacterium]|nr:hypothetical protein [Clostridia bacterium]
MAGTRLTAAQKKEIFRRAVFDGECAEQLAEEYSVSREEIERVTHDKKRIADERDTLEAMRELAKLRVMASADRAVQKQLELMDRQVPENMLYINQKAAADIMNRAGIKQEKKDVGEVRVVFKKGNVAFNMPEPEPSAPGGRRSEAERQE